MSDNPTTTGEWTAEWLRQYLSGYSSYDLQLKAISKLFAAERKAIQFSEHDLIAKFDEQLAAERKKRDQLWQQVTDDAKEIQQLREQLAAAQAANKALIDFAEWGWTIIANANGGNWETASQEWQDAAAKYRDKFHQDMRQPCATTALDAAIAEATDAAVQEMMVVKQNRDRDIAEATKPLVDALHQLTMRVLQSDFYLQAKQETDDALLLAKVKEGKK